MIWNENDGIYINFPGITHFPFKVRRTWNHIIVYYILFSLLWSQNQFTCLLFFTPNFILFWKQAFMKHTNMNTGFYAAFIPNTREQRKGAVVYSPGSQFFSSPWRATCHLYLLATVQLDFVCSCFIAKYIECSKEPGQSKLLDIFVVNILMYSL